MTRTAALLATAALTTTLGAGTLGAGTLGAGLAAAAPAQAAPFCGITWGSLAKSAAPMSQGRLTGVRAGRHDCYDRLVLDVAAGQVQGWNVSYVDHVTADGSGAVVPTRGGAALELVARVPAAEDYPGGNRAELAPVAGFRTFRQVVWAGSFEGQTTLGLGVRAKLPFRVLAVDGPGTGSRLVVDVAHQW